MRVCGRQANRISAPAGEAYVDERWEVGQRQRSNEEPKKR